MNLYKSYGIYGIHNKVNDMVYVGKTETSFGDRRDCHIASLRGGYHINPHLQNAWNKYGEDNFEFIVLYECKNHESSDMVNELEICYIKEYSDLGLAYNIGAGGDGGNLLGKHLSDETKAKIGAKNKVNMTGRKASDSTKAKMSSSQKARYAAMSDEEHKKLCLDIAQYASGYKWSEEAKKKFSELQQEKPNAAKYDATTIREIRRMHEQEGKTIAEIADHFEMKRQNVYMIVTYRRWKNVK